MIQHRTQLNELLPKNPICAELGVAEGYFSYEMLKWGAKVIMVDIWAQSLSYPGDAQNKNDWHEKNFNDMLKRLDMYSDKIYILNYETNKAHEFVENNSLDLVYIDACHSYDCVLSDLTNWLKKVKKGGIIAGHDYLAPQYGVKQAVNEFCSKHNYIVHLIPEFKEEDAGFWFKVTH